MKLGFVGLGKMGGKMVERLINGGHEIITFDLVREAADEAEKKGAVPAGSLQELVGGLDAPRAIWGPRRS